MEGCTHEEELEPRSRTVGIHLVSGSSARRELDGLLLPGEDRAGVTLVVGPVGACLLSHVIERGAGVVKQLGEIRSRVGALEVTDDFDAVDLNEPVSDRSHVGPDYNSPQP